MSVTIDMTCFRIMSGSARISIVLPTDLLIFRTPSVPRTVGASVKTASRLGERLAVAAVERPDDLAAQLEVGRLVLADRDAVGAVDDDVGRLQDRVGEQRVVDVVGLLLASSPCRSASARPS